MEIKKYTKKAWKGLTSEKAKATYKSTGKTISKFGAKTSRYFKRTNRSLDRIVGTRDPNPGKLTGVALPKGYTIKKIPKIIKGPKGYSIYEENRLVRINSSRRRKVIKKKKPVKRKATKVKRRRRR